jgi:septum formation protein
VNLSPPKSNNYYISRDAALIKIRPIVLIEKDFAGQCGINNSIMMTRKLILASASPRRAELLQQLGLSFRVIASDLPEEVSNGDPARLVKKLALQKAMQVGRSLGGGLVLGADTLVVLGRSILGKPSDAAAASKMLQQLSGKEHSVYTGLALLDAASGRQLTDTVKTKVRFRQLQGVEIEAYVATGEPLDKAGAYGIQGRGAALVESISGCYFNVVGLPLSRLVVMLREFDFPI